MILKYLIEKEFKQIVRNSFLPKLIIMMPCMMMLVLPWAANLEVKNIHLGVVNHDKSPSANRLIEKVYSSGYFKKSQVVTSYDEGLTLIEKGKADIILEIPLNFEKQLFNENKSDILLLVNAVNGTKGSIGSNYLTSIMTDFNRELRTKSPQNQNMLKSVNPISLQFRFNKELDYKNFMVPAMMVMLLTLICGFLPALNIVGEKETGTIEQINVTPVKKLTFIAAKLIPYWCIGFVVLTLCLIIAYLVYGLVPQGNLLSIYFCAMLYILGISGLGMVISNYSGTMQQAMFVMFFFMIICILMSGLFTPINSMPQWAQDVTTINPLRYFITCMRSIYLKGSSLWQLKDQLLSMTLFAIILNGWAVWSYKKKN